MYADEITGSMREALDETERREAQIRFNIDHGITPESIRKEVRDLSEIQRVADRSAGSSSWKGAREVQAPISSLWTSASCSIHQGA